MRVSTFHAQTEASDSKDIVVDGESWVETNINGKESISSNLMFIEPNEEAQEIPEIPTVKPKSNDDSDDDEEAAEINLADLSIQGSADLTICYDQYHQTPRVWLFGYDEVTFSHRI
jgi:hypothetical protein